MLHTLNRYAVISDADNIGKWIVYDRNLRRIFDENCTREDAFAIADHMERVHIRSQQQIANDNDLRDQVESGFEPFDWDRYDRRPNLIDSVGQYQHEANRRG